MTHLNLGLVDYGNGDGQEQYNKSDGSQQEKNVQNMVPDSARPIAQIPTQSEEPMNWKEDEDVTKKDDDVDSDATVLYDPEENNWVSYRPKLFTSPRFIHHIM